MPAGGCPAGRRWCRAAGFSQCPTRGGPIFWSRLMSNAARPNDCRQEPWRFYYPGPGQSCMSTFSSGSTRRAKPSVEMVTRRFRKTGAEVRAISPPDNRLVGKGSFRIGTSRHPTLPQHQAPPIRDPWSRVPLDQPATALLKMTVEAVRIKDQLPPRVTSVERARAQLNKRAWNRVASSSASTECPCESEPAGRICQTWGTLLVGCGRRAHRTSCSGASHTGGRRRHLDGRSTGQSTGGHLACVAGCLGGICIARNSHRSESHACGTGQSCGKSRGGTGRRDRRSRRSTGDRPRAIGQCRPQERPHAGIDGVRLSTGRDTPVKVAMGGAQPPSSLPTGPATPSSGTGCGAAGSCDRDGISQ